MTLDPGIAARLKRNADGLFTAVVQERSSGDVLMVAWMDDDALARTLKPVRRPTFRGHAASSGSRAQPLGIPNTCIRCGWIATVTQCWWWSTKSVVPVTPATTAVSTPTCCWVLLSDYGGSPEMVRLLRVACPSVGRAGAVVSAAAEPREQVSGWALPRG